MLTERYAEKDLNLVSKADWHPYPTASDRDAWESLPQAVRDYRIQRGVNALEFDWPSLKATLFLEVERIGNRINFETVHFERRGKVVDLALAECMENKGRFVDELVNGLWLLLEESFWGLPAHLYAQAAGLGLPDTADITVDLFAAETGALVAWVAYLLKPQLDAVSPLIVPRIAREVTTRILEPNLNRDDAHWMGFNSDRRPNNWNPWINSNWLACMLLVEEDPTKRRAHLNKIFRSLDKFIDPYPTDGGCDEGPNYWGRAAASLFDNLHLMYAATDGQIDVYGEQLVQEMGRFVPRTQLGGDFFVNFADANAVVEPEASLVYRYGKAINDPDMMALGRWCAERQNLYAPLADKTSFGGRPALSLGRALPEFFILEEMAAEKGKAPLPRDVFLDVIEVMVARDQDGSTEGFAVAAKGGHNAESHNHNDIGHFIALVDGAPVLIDAGVQTYSMKTFSKDRYDIWTMQSGYHSLPTINGVMQAPGEEFAARDVSYVSDDAHAEMTLEIAGAYPPEAKLDSWKRTVRLDRGAAITITDRYKLSAPAQSLTMSLMSASTVKIDGDKLKLSPAEQAGGRLSGTATIHFDAGKFSAEVETITVDDARMRSSWGDTLYRVVLTAKNPAQEDTFSMRITR